MKKRRLAVIAFLLVAVICIGVGYAANTDTLEVNGKIDYSHTGQELDPNVYFTGVTSNLNNCNADETTASDDVAEMAVVLASAQIGSTASATFEIASTYVGTVQLAVDVDQITVGQAHFEVSADFAATELTCATSVTPATTTVTVTVTVKTVPATEMTDVAFYIPLTATVVE